MTHDICINKHQNNPQSNAANLKVNKVKDREFIYNFIKEHGYGYLKQIARHIGKEKNEISGRFTELKSEEFNLIEEAKDEHGKIKKLEDCTVYQLKELKLF